MKLLVNTKAGRVLYAEAGKDVVDFLFSLLTLPLGAVVKMLSKDAMVGCIGNLYGSVEEMDSAYLRSAEAKNALLSPPGGYGSGTRLLQLQAPALEVFQCNKGGDGNCYNYVTVARSAPCRLCHGEMDVPIEVVGFSDPVGLGFVKEVVTYTVMDDLKVAPLSTVSCITLLNALGVTDISSLQETTVRVGYAEGLEMLRASLQSKAVLTDVFLRKKSRRRVQAVAAPSNKKRKLKAITLS
ncbi:uncharacterized protein [Miscanthus floridulus]|uniref:uncharacterized protein n=1 Tax=Miscanthus floridulus TaxID=154761 RepID=UPI0034580F0A